MLFMADIACIDIKWIETRVNRPKYVTYYLCRESIWIEPLWFFRNTKMPPPLSCGWLVHPRFVTTPNFLMIKVIIFQVPTNLLSLFCSKHPSNHSSTHSKGLVEWWISIKHPKENIYFNDVLYHKIIQIHNNVMWDWQYSADDCPHSVWMRGIFHQFF